MADVRPAFIVDGQPRFYDFYALADTSLTALVKSSYGFIHALAVTGGTAGTITLYDNTEASGTIIAAFGTEAVAANGSEGSVKADSYLFDIAFQTGLVVSTTAVDTPRVTISYR